MDKTDEILVVYILSKFFLFSHEKIYRRIELEFFDCLNKMQMYVERINIDNKIKEQLKILGSCQQLDSQKKNEKKGAEYALTCFFCQTSINQDRQDQRNSFVNKDNVPYVLKQ